MEREVIALVEETQKKGMKARIWKRATEQEEQSQQGKKTKRRGRDPEQVARKIEEG